MKNLLTILSLLFCTGLMAQKDFDQTVIRISPNSELIIAGSTNVNKFDCKFNIDLITSPKQVEYTSTNNCIFFHDLKLELTATGFDCGHKKMNEDFQDLLKSDQFPVIKIQVEKVQFISPEYVKAFIKVYMAGKENYYDLPVHTENQHYIGKFKMNIRDFGLEPPTKALGLIEVDEQIEVNFNLNIRE